MVVLLCLVPSFEAGQFQWESARAPLLATIVLLDVIVMFATPEFSAPRQAAIDTNVVRYLDRHLGEQRFYTLGPFGPNYGSYYALSALNVNDLPIPKAFGNFVPRSLDSNQSPYTFTGTVEVNPKGPSPAQELVDNLAQYQAVGVKYVILPPGLRLPPSRVAGISVHLCRYEVAGAERSGGHVNAMRTREPRPDTRQSVDCGRSASGLAEDAPCIGYLAAGFEVERRARDRQIA